MTKNTTRISRKRSKQFQEGQKSLKYTVSIPYDLYLIYI